MVCRPRFASASRGRRSSGALIAGGVAIGRVADLRVVWTELFGSQVCEPRRLLRGRWPYRMSEIVGGVASRYFGDRLLADTVIPISVVVTQLRASGLARRALTARDPLPLATAILASCFLPGPYLAHGADRSPSHVRRRVAGARADRRGRTVGPAEGDRVCERRPRPAAARRVVAPADGGAGRNRLPGAVSRSPRCRSARSTSIGWRRWRRSRSAARARVFLWAGTVTGWRAAVAYCTPRSAVSPNMSPGHRRGPVEGRTPHSCSF